MLGNFGGLLQGFVGIVLKLTDWRKGGWFSNDLYHWFHTGNFVWGSRWFRIYYVLYFYPDYDKHLFVTWVETTTKVLQFAPETFMGLKDPPEKNNQDSNGKYPTRCTKIAIWKILSRPISYWKKVEFS